ncbi:MAG TPA: YbhB/YbcL family Raf kinase inhibitor-like protein [Thermoanaerobaculia bacterium]
MRIESSAFQHQQPIPPKHTCDGEDVSPPLRFIDVPDDAMSFVLIVDDPDVPPAVSADRNWDHWLVWNIPPQTREIREGEHPTGVEGRNSWGRNEYGGPCPPDREHRYFFKLFALDITLDLNASAGKSDLLPAIEGHVLAQAELVGLYDRKRR